MISTGEKSFRKASEEMWGSLDVSLEDGFETMQNHLEMDSGFEDFFKFTTKYNVPFSVISAGIKPLLKHVLDAFLGSERSKRIDIVSNDATITHNGSQWTPVWRHDTELGHDKALSIREFKQSVAPGQPQPLVVFIGDGVSDLAAAGEADVLFARKGLKLEQHCIKNSIPYIPYNSFTDIQDELESLVVGNRYHDPSIPKVSAKNMSRPRFMRTSSQLSVDMESAAVSSSLKLREFAPTFVN